MSLESSDDFAAALADPRRLAQWRDQRPRAAVLRHLEPMGLGDRLDALLALPRPVVPAMDRDDDIARLRAACRWRLLLQLSADRDDELLFNQDGGFVYFLIPADDLPAGRWDRVQCVTQFG